MLGKLGIIISEILLLNESYKNEGKLTFVPRILKSDDVKKYVLESIGPERAMCISK